MFFPVWRVLLGHNLTFNDFTIACGYAQFVAWSLSFYPQLVSNYKRQSVVGLSLDFVLLNNISFACYLLYLIMTWGSRSHETQDLVFAIHALLCCSFLAIQCFVFERDIQRVSRVSKFLFIAVLFAMSTNLLLLLRHVESVHWFAEQLDVIRVALAAGKYLPQVYLNYKRRSTVGLAIRFVALDFIGSFFSFLELCIVINDKGATSDTVFDLVLALLSALFGLVLLRQHYWSYPHKPAKRHRGAGTLAHNRSNTKAGYTEINEADEEDVTQGLLSDQDTHQRGQASSSHSHRHPHAAI